MGFKYPGVGETLEFFWTA